MTGLGLRDKNGIELHNGDEVSIVFWDRRTYTGRVHYDKANACWKIGTERICEIGREMGSTIEVLDHLEGHSKPVKSRRKGKSSPAPEQGGTRSNIQ